MKRNYSSNHPIFEIAIVMGLAIFLSSASKSCNRSEAHMVYIENGYCYQEDSKIIYIEQDQNHGHTSYVPYYDKNGKMNYYDVTTNEWIPVE